MIKNIFIFVLLIALLSPLAGAVTEDDAIGVYYIEEGTGTNLDDAAAADNDGTLGATATWDSTDKWANSDWAVLCDEGATDYFTIPHSTANSFENSSFTVMMRVYAQENYDTPEANNRQLATKKDAVHHVDGWSFQINKYGDHGLILELGDGTSREMTYSDDIAWATHTSYVLAASFDRTTSTTTYYQKTGAGSLVNLNGAAYTTLSGTYPTLDAADPLTVMGGAGVLDPTHGSADWFLIFDSALTSAQITDVITSMDAGQGAAVYNTTTITPTFYDPENETNNLIWTIAGTTGTVNSINVSYTNTQTGNIYRGYLDLATDVLINTLTAGYAGEVLWINTTNTSNNTFFISEEFVEEPEPEWISPSEIPWLNNQWYNTINSFLNTFRRWF